MGGRKIAKITSRNLWMLPKINFIFDLPFNLLMAVLMTLDDLHPALFEVLAKSSTVSDVSPS